MSKAAPFKFLFFSSILIFFNLSPLLSQRLDTRAFDLIPSTTIQGDQSLFDYPIYTDAGDINGDGFDDLLIRSALSIFDAQSDSVFYILYGKPFTGQNPFMSLADINAGGGFGIRNPSIGKSSIVAVGDINSDGFDDLAISDYDESAFLIEIDATGATKTTEVTEVGKVYFLYGGGTNRSGVMDPTQLSVTEGFTLNGGIDDQNNPLASAGKKFGEQVASAGDFNGDGIDDVLFTFSEQNASVNNNALVLFGRAANDSFGSFPTTQFFLSVEEALLLTGFIPGSLNSNIAFGVKTAGDINGDGFDDLLFPTSQTASTSFTVRGFTVVYGNANSKGTKLLSTFTASDGFAMEGGNLFNGIRSIQTGGDFDGDGMDDIVITTVSDGAEEMFTDLLRGEATNNNLVHTYGSTLGSRLTNFRTSGRQELRNEELANVTAIVNTNNDGLADISIAAFTNTSGLSFAEGVHYVAKGSQQYADTVDLTNPSFDEGFTITYHAGAFLSRIGTPDIGQLGDYNNDGIDDLSFGDYIIFTSDSLGRNAPPQLINPIPDQILHKGFVEQKLSVKEFFNELDGEEIFFEVLANRDNPLSLTVLGDSVLLEETVLSSLNNIDGINQFFVRAYDQNRAVTVDTFRMIINSPPTLPAGRVSLDKVVSSGFETIEVSLAGVFVDPEGLPLSYGVVSSDENIVIVDVDGDLITIREVSENILDGKSTITVTATDFFGFTLSGSFETIINSAPLLVKPFEDVVLQVGEMLTVPNLLSETFSDFDQENLTLGISFGFAGGTSFSGDNLSAIIVDDQLTLEAGTVNRQALNEVYVSATDIYEFSTVDTFSVRVNDQIRMLNSYLDVVISEGTPEYSTSQDVGYFIDDDPLTYSASSSNTEVATVAMDGRQVVVTNIGVGSAQITVIAEDDYGSSLSQAFDFTVDGAPVVASIIDDITVREGFGIVSVDLTGVFTDPEGGALSYNWGIDSPIVTIDLTGTILTMEELVAVSNVENASANITLSATDLQTQSIDTSFNLTIEYNQLPVFDVDINELSVTAGTTSSVELLTLVTDPEESEMTYEVTIADPTLAAANIEDNVMSLEGLRSGETNLEIIATDANNGRSIKNFVLLVGSPLGIDDVEIKIFPNPSSSLVTIDPSSIGSFDIAVTDMLGHKLFVKEELNSRTDLDVSTWSKGLYIIELKLHQSNSTQLLKFIKE